MRALPFGGRKDALSAHRSFREAQSCSYSYSWKFRDGRRMRTVAEELKGRMGQTADPETLHRPCRQAEVRVPKMTYLHPPQS